MIKNLIFDFGKVLVDYEFDLLDTLFDDADECARFKSVVTLIIDGEMHFFEGTLEGKIAQERVGTQGFGYDPVFIADEAPDHTVAELGDEFKNRISHRGKALRAMAAWLRENS